MKALKIFGSVFLLLMVLLVGAIVLLPHIINPNDYRTQIEQKVKETTGYQVVINGPMSWSLFPWLGLSLDDISVKDSNNAQLAALKKANVSVRLLPILKKHLEVDELTINGLSLNLIKGINNRGNWQLPVSKKPTTEPEKTKPQANELATDTNGVHQAESQTTPITFGSVNVDISDLLVSYQDLNKGQKLLLGPASLKIEAAAADQPFFIQGNFPLVLNQPNLSIETKLSSKVNIQKNGYRLDDLVLISTPQNSSNPVKIMGNLQLIDNKIDAQLSLDRTNIQKLLTDLNLPKVPTANSKALTDVAASITLRGDSQNLSLPSVQINLDSTVLKGKANLAKLNNLMPQIQFQLNGSTLNLDDYLPPESQLSPSAEQKVKADDKKAHNSQSQVDPKARASNSPLLPASTLKMLRELDLNGGVSFDQLTVKKIPLVKPLLKISARKGIIEINELAAELFDGGISANGALDVRTNRPSFKTTARVNQVQLAPVGQIYPQLKALSGNLSADMKLASRFISQNQLIQNLNGKVGFAVNKGSIAGVNADRLLCQAVAKIRKEKLTQTDWPKQTDFKNLKGSFIIKNGRANNQDLVASLSQLNVKGKGYADLPSQTLDYQLALTITGSGINEDPACKINEKYDDIKWPVRCKGKIGEANLCGVDSKALGAEVINASKKDLTDKINKKLDKKLGPDLSNKLKKLFQ